jgi:hypothetical protein
VPPFREENSSDLRGAFLRFRTMDDARTAFHKLNGRMGPGGETLHMVMTRPPAVDPNQMWGWANEVEEMRKSGGGEGGEACLEHGWEGLGFATRRMKNAMILGWGVGH